MKEILKVLVGSQAHGLANEDSDYDYRAVFVQPTAEILKLGGVVKNTNWIEGKEDNTSWELGHFLNMAIHCNPTILEVFLAPMSNNENDPCWPLGIELRNLFPHIWSSKGVMESFIGYGLNQRKKFLDNKDNRASKYAVAYMRTLYQAHQLLYKGTFTIKISETPIGDMLREWKYGNPDPGEIISECIKMEKLVRSVYESMPKKETNLEPINEFLLRVRKEYWNE